jgi:kynurenine formamidase
MDIAAGTGAPERLGRLSELNDERVLAAAALVRTGRVFDLGLEINERMPQGARGVFVPFSRAFSATPEGTGGETSPFTFSAEAVTGTLHTSTHIDALIHIQAYGKIFDGSPASASRTDAGWQKYGAETIAPIVGRCLVLDVAGPSGRLEDGYEITIADLERTLSAADAEVRPGDIVLVRTGKIHEFWSDPAAFERSQPGVGTAAAVWLYEQGMSVLGTDTTSTEPVPFLDEEMTTHRAMLVERGVHLLENLWLEDVASAGVTEALFVCLPLKFTGATGSWIRPIAIV